MALTEFEYAADMARVRGGGPWLCLNMVALLHDWCLDLAPEEIRMNQLGVWAQLHNLLIGAVVTERDIGEKLSCYIGKFIKVDTEETKKKFIRVRVEIDIDKPVVTGFLLRRPNRDSLWISVKYERLPSLCNGCGRLSHEGEDCREETEYTNQSSRRSKNDQLVVGEISRKEPPRGAVDLEDKQKGRWLKMRQEPEQSKAKGRLKIREEVQSNLGEGSTRLDVMSRPENLMDIEVRIAATSEEERDYSAVHAKQCWKEENHEGGRNQISSGPVKFVSDGPDARNEARNGNGPNPEYSRSPELKVDLATGLKGKEAVTGRKKEEKLKKKIKGEVRSRFHPYQRVETTRSEDDKREATVVVFQQEGSAGTVVQPYREQ
ncbi:unnamed protein product [Rhodiola kirilowii]